MVGNSATRLAREFQRAEGRRHDTNMKPQGGRSIAGPSLRGLWGRSATGHNGQAAKEEISARWRGAGWRKNVSGVPAGRSVFHPSLFGPFNRASPDSSQEIGFPRLCPFRILLLRSQ